VVDAEISIRRRSCFTGHDAVARAEHADRGDIDWLLRRRVDEPAVNLAGVSAACRSRLRVRAIRGDDQERYA
jgi:hypothetical protein